MDPQRSIYPQRVRTKKRWADLTHLAHISKLALATSKIGSAACDLPPEGSKKECCADLTHLAHFEELANL